MAYQTSTLRLAIDSAQAEKNARQLAKMLDKTKKSASGAGDAASSMSKSFSIAKLASTNLDGEMQKIRKSALGVRDGILKLSAAGAVVVALTQKVANNAKELQNQSNLANTATDEFQRMAYAARTVGVNQDNLSDILKDVNDKVGDFLSTGGGELADFFENIAPQVGVTADQFRDLSGKDALQLYVDSLEKANLSQAEMTFYMEAIANDGTALLPILRNNGDELGRLGDEAERMGLILSDLDIAKLAEFSEVSRQVLARVTSIANEIGAALSPFVAQLGRDFLGAADDANTFGEYAEKSVYAVAAGVGVVADGVELVNRTFQLGGNAVAGFALAVQTAMLQAAETITRGPIDRLNKLIEIMNELPGVDIKMVDQPQFVDDLGRMRDLAEGAYVESTKDFERIWNAPWPSDNIDAWVANVQDGMVKTAESLEDVEDSADNAGGGIKRLTQTQAAATQAMGTALNTFQSLRAEFDPLGVATDSYLTKQSQLKLLLDQGAISAEQYRQAMILLSQQLRAGLAEGDMSGGFMGQVETGGVAGNQATTGGQGSQAQLDPFQQWLESARTAFTDFDALTASTASNFTQSFGNAFADVITGSDNLGDAFANMASSMSTAILSAIGEMIAQWLVYEAVQLASGASAQASAATTMTANALATQQQAALAAYASTAAIPQVGPTLAPGAAAAALAATTPFVTGVASNALAGMAHDGIDSVPNEGTWLLDRGERVVDSRTNEDLKSYLASANSMQSSVATGASEGSTTYNIEVTAPVTVESSGEDDNAAKSQGEAAGKALTSIILQTIQKQQRPGGMLAGTAK